MDSIGEMLKIPRVVHSNLYFSSIFFLNSLFEKVEQYIAIMYRIEIYSMYCLVTCLSWCVSYRKALAVKSSTFAHLKHETIFFLCHKYILINMGFILTLTCECSLLTIQTILPRIPFSHRLFLCHYNGVWVSDCVGVCARL